MPRYRAIFTEPPIQFNRQDFSHNVLFAMPKPNIDGAFEAAYYTEQLKVRKAFHRGMDLNGHALSGTDRSSISMEFNAEDSNPIYSPECDTVQPKSLRFLCLIRFQ